MERQKASFDESVKDFKKRYEHGDIRHQLYSDDLTPKENLIKKLRYFYHPYSAELNYSRHMNFEEQHEDT